MEYFKMFRQLWFYADRERWKVAVYLVLHAISFLGELGQPYAFSMIINTLQQNNPSVVNEVIHWVLFYVLCFFTFEIFHRGARYIEIFVAFRIRKRFVNAMFNRLQSLPLGWHSDHHSGSVIDRVNKAADGLYNFSLSQYNFVGFFIKFWGPLFILWNISPVISCITVISGVVSVIITKKFYNLIVPAYRAQNEQLHNVTTALHDYISNIRTVIMLRLGQPARRDIDERIKNVLPHLVKEHNFTQLKCFIAAFIIMFLEIGLILYYIYAQKEAGHVIMIGSVTAIFFYLQQCMSSFQFYTFDYEIVIHQTTDFEAVRPILAEKVAANVYEQEESALGRWNKLDVQSLRYSYGDGKHQLTDVSVRLIIGQRIAFVGESGAGKSTLLQLLRGLVPVQEGALIKDDSRAVPFLSLASTTALIPQEAEIFENTVRYNITMGMPAAEEDIRSAIWTAGFSEVVHGLPNGLDSDIREKGVNLSGGQKQRLALARGIFAVRDSSIVLLDEPTSNVDPATETVIFNRLFERLSGKCVVSVLHRLHLVRHFDYVYVFKQGKIVEEGTFLELCSADGEFSRLWNEYLVEEDAFGKAGIG